MRTLSSRKLGIGHVSHEIRRLGCPGVYSGGRTALLWLRATRAWHGLALGHALSLSVAPRGCMREFPAGAPRPLNRDMLGRLPLVVAARSRLESLAVAGARARTLRCDRSAFACIRSGVTLVHEPSRWLGGSYNITSGGRMEARGSLIFRPV